MADTLPTLIPLAEVDPELVEQVLDRAFGPGRHGRTAYIIREGTDYLPALSFAALDRQDHLVGTIQCWPVGLNEPSGRAYPLVMVGPVAVLPERQGEGFGIAMMLAVGRSIGPEAPLPQVLIGDAPYYGRFGYRQAPAGWRCPGPWDPARLLVRCAEYSVLPTDGMLGPWRG